MQEEWCVRQLHNGDAKETKGQTKKGASLIKMWDFKNSYVECFTCMAIRLS